jgi:hypothetical protein
MCLNCPTPILKFICAPNPTVHLGKGKGKGKAIPLQALRVPGV